MWLLSFCGLSYDDSFVYSKLNLRQVRAMSRYAAAGATPRGRFKFNGGFPSTGPSLHVER